ncbi:YXWGXW repeat-containing protein [Azospira restricta]|uniref:YXWGXW repeat-containing protein n=1 Tax=Azospira restricta TaxID=404405 RepID=A0A974PWA4_9RHOO|nr:YXWGXW repeat-containing protein [Azospira restricta]QRJ62652.1 YXWGXW repeat-containing protein [Azospira restricta]
MNKRKLLIAGLLAVPALLAGCVVAPSEPVYVETVRVAPPPPYVEYIGSPPVVGYIWISGYWNWIGARYVWVPGRWVEPRHGHRWVPHRWERHGEQWRRYGGHWERDDHPAPRIIERREAPRFERHDDRRSERDVRPAPERNERWRNDATPRREAQVVPRVEQHRDEVRTESRPSERDFRRDADDDDRGRHRGRADRDERPQRGWERGNGRGEDR